VSPDAPVQTARKRFEERTDPRTGEKYMAVFGRGAALRDDSFLNKGTCFTLEERDALDLRGVLPPGVATPAEQELRSYANYCKSGDDLDRYLFLAALQDRNETLYYRLLLDHLEEMVPIVYTPTVGKACEHYSHLYRRPRGVFVSLHDRGCIKRVLRNSLRDNIEIIVATDNEAILGIGDQGVGGMGITIGKLALYTAGAGIHPTRGLPLDIDVGTNNEKLLNDPLYLGVRQPRLRGEAYITLMDELVDALNEVYPGALVQWEDFSNQVAFQVLRRYRDRLLSFDDDIQGTASVVESGVRTAVERVGRKLADERMVFFGAGASGSGCALQMRNALRAEGLSAAEVGRRVLCLDSKGLILSDRKGLEGQKVDVATDPSVAAGWKGAQGGMFSLLEVVRNFKPTILLGMSGQPGTFTEEVIKAMHQSCPRPIVLAMSNPTSKVEAPPADILRWTNGAAVVGTGSPFAPVELNGVKYVIGQCNNAFAFPGIGLGAILVRARKLPDEAFAAAARAIHEYTGPASGPGAAIYPPISKLREVSRVVAVAVARCLVDIGAAPKMPAQEIEDRVASSMWEPVYRRYRAE
jgi:malic enzyme